MHFLCCFLLFSYFIFYAPWPPGLFLPPRSVRIFFCFFELVPVRTSLNHLTGGQVDDNFPHQRTTWKDSLPERLKKTNDTGGPRYSRTFYLRSRLCIYISKLIKNDNWQLRIRGPKQPKYLPQITRETCIYQTHWHMPMFDRYPSYAS